LAANTVVNCGGGVNDNAPSGYVGEDCSVGGTDVCVWTNLANQGEFSCAGNDLNEADAYSVSMKAVYDYGGEGQFTAWGEDSGGTKFCCALDDVDNLLDAVVLWGTPYDDTLKFTFSGGDLDAHTTRILDGQAYGLDGDDTIWGSTSTNSYYRDELWGDHVGNTYSGSDTINGNQGADNICGGPDVDIINGGNGPDIIEGNNGNDIIDGGSGNDTIDGGIGADTINGGDHSDTIDGGLGGDTIEGGSGVDTIHGDGGDDIIQGNDGADFLYGDAGDDTICDDQDADTQDGGTGGHNILWHGTLGVDAHANSYAGPNDTTTCQSCGHFGTWGHWTNCETCGDINSIPLTCPAW